MPLLFNSLLGYARGIYSCPRNMLRPVFGLMSRNASRERKQDSFRNFYAAYRVSAFSEWATASGYNQAGSSMSIEAHQTIK